MSGIPRPQWTPDGVDPTHHNLKDDGDRQPPGCWKLVALIALPLGLCVGAGGFASLSAKSVTPSPVAITATATATGTPQPMKPTERPLPTTTPAYPITTTPFLTPQAIASMEPTSSSAFCYRRVAVGDTVSGIAAQYRVTIATIQRYNTWLKNPSYIYRGAVLKIPCKKS